MSHTSVIIPVFNGATFIRDAIESVLSQAVDGVEVVVVNDGSTDGTASIVEGIRDRRVQLLHQDNGGESKARNRGLEISSGEYVLFLDADDLLMPGSLANLKNAILRQGAASAAYGRCRTFGEAVRTWPEDSVLPTGSITRDLIEGRITLVPGQVLLRRGILKRIGGFNTAIRYGEDWEFMLRLSAESEFVATNEIVLEKRIHAKMQTFDKGRPDIVDLRMTILERFSSSTGHDDSIRWVTPSVKAEWLKAQCSDQWRSGQVIRGVQSLVRAARESGDWSWVPRYAYDRLCRRSAHGKERE